LIAPVAEFDSCTLGAERAGIKSRTAQFILCTRPSGLFIDVVVCLSLISEFITPLSHLAAKIAARRFKDGVTVLVISTEAG
jgi:hypothetical protein